jgi:hypothetical protein
MKQLGSEIEGFSEKVEYKDVTERRKSSMLALRGW